MKITKILAVIAIIVLAACNESDQVSDSTIEGTYKGTLTASTLKTTDGATSSDPISATAVVSTLSDNEIEIHCYSDELDTTFFLNYYEYHDSVMVCLTGTDFEHMYGHSLGQGHMMGGMMGDMHQGETEWEHHLSDEHQDGDEHFGGFDMPGHSFSYQFEMMENQSTYYLNFHGTKEQ